MQKYRNTEIGRQLLDQCVAAIFLPTSHLKKAAAFLIQKYRKTEIQKYRNAEKLKYRNRTTASRSV